MDMPSPSGRESFPKRASGAALRHLGLLAVVWASAPAMAAPCSRDDCENVARALYSTRISVHNLTIRVVDLGDPDRADQPAGPVGLAESMAPLLFLTPRVTSILEDVFNDSDAVQIAAETARDADQSVDGHSPVEETDEGPTSPVAGTGTRAPDRYGPSSLEGAATLPKFQRQMYRTDI